MIPSRAGGLLPLVFVAASLWAAAGDWDAPGHWPEEQQAFLFDGPGLLLTEAQREELRSLIESERREWIEDFLGRDPLPETEANELVEGIRRRQLLVRNDFLTLQDHRARLLFLHGRPDERSAVECGATFNPIEIWRYGERQLVLYQPREDRPFRLWHPLDSKRALYNADMAYWLTQLDEINYRRRIDIKACPDARRVDAATGVEALRGFRDGRPTHDEIAAWLKPPRDLAAWSRAAAAERLDDLAPPLEVKDIQVFFPERRGQRIVTRVLIELPPDVGIERYVEEERAEYRLILEGVVEQDGELFEDFRVRYKLPPPEEDVAIALTFDRALRPERAFRLRFRLEDEIGGARTYVNRGITVPEEPTAVAEPPVPADVVVAMGEELARERFAGQDSLLLVPPESDVILGLWRADALVTGERIREVVFLVDGQAQLRRVEPPFTAEVRLARFPREQVVRAEGYDGSGELVAADEVIVNQPRGAFRVRIVEPESSAVVVGEVPARAEIVVPEERRVEQVRFLLNDELVAEMAKAPWQAVLDVPGDGQVAYLSVVAVLDDGSRAEDVRFLNSPRYLEEVEVNLVELPTTVIDGAGRPVPDLERDSFEIYEEGRPQEMTRFERVEDLPLAVGITIDTSGSMATLLPEAQRAAVEFLDNVITPRDKAFAVSFAKEPLLLIPPTDDVGAVEAALENLRSLGWTALHDAVVSSLYYFRALRGRKALVLLSDGNDSASFYPFRDALEYARRSGVVVYTVGLDVGTFQTDIRKKLHALARETGGRTFFIQQAEELRGVYREIERELRSQYLLAYNSDAAGGDEFRTVEVKVLGGKMKARTIAGYYP